jgi:tetratricopeptide (TPR) repeat protein
MSKIRIELFLFFLLCLVQVHAQDAGARGGVLLKTDKNSDAGKTRAVIIGISKYSNLPPQRQLDYADKDAELFYTYLQLTKSVADCRVFLNNEAIASKILLAIDELIRQSVPGDNLIIYFAGHGDVAKDKTKDQDDAYLLCTNVATDADYSMSDAISLSQLQKLIADAAKTGISVNLITDACRSGKIATSEEAAYSTAYLLSQKWDKVMKLASCQENELSYENVKWGNGHGVFTYYLVRGLSKEADVSPKDNMVTLKELELYIKKEVSEATEDVQNPIKVGGDARRVFAALLKEDLLDQSSSLPKSQTLLAARSGGNHSFFQSPKLEQLHNSFKTHVRSGRLSDSAYIVYLEFALADTAKKNEVLLKNELILELVASAQRLIDKYLQGGNDMPDASHFQKASADLSLAIKLYNKKNVISEQWNSKQLFLQAFSYIRSEQRQKYPEAISLLKRALKKNKKAAYIYQAFGRLYNNMEEYELSEKYLLKAIALAPRWTYPRSDLGNTYFDMNRWESSKKQFDQALSLDSSLAKLYNNMSRIYLEQGKLAKSEQLFLKADSLVPNTAVYFSNLGCVYLNQGRIEKAMTMFDKALALDSAFYGTYARLGNYYLYDSDDFQKAEKALYYLIKANQLEPYFSTSYRDLGNYYDKFSANAERVDEGIRLFKKAIELNPHSRGSYYDLAVLLKNRKKDSIGADKTIELLIRNNKKSAEAFYYRGLYNEYVNRLKDAEADYKKAIRLDPYLKETYLDLSLLQEKQQRITDAEKSLLPLLEYFPESPEISFTLGNFYLRNNNSQKAINFYQSSLQMDSSYSFAWSSLAFTLLKHTMQVTEAVNAFNRARSLNLFKHNPVEFATLIRLKADSLNSANSLLETTVRFYEAALALDPSKKDGINIEIAKAHYLAGNLIEAKAALARVESNLSYNLRQTLVNLQWKIYLEEGTLEKANHLIEQEMGELQFPSYTGKALYYYLANDTEKARELLKQELSENPGLLEKKYLKNNYNAYLLHLIETILP